jgi:lysophospholipase L1-like esterase
MSALAAGGPIAVIGAADLVETAEGVVPQRLSGATRRLIDDEALKRVAAMGAGVRLAFETDSDRIEIRATTSGLDDVRDHPRWDLVIDGAITRSEDARSDTLRFADLGGHRKSVELWLPQFGVTAIREVRLEPSATVLPPPPDPRPVMVAYGSSITQCRDAFSPTRTWPSLVARELGASLVNRGFAGECYLDPVVGRELATIDAPYFHLCLGANIYSGGFTRRTLGPAVIGLVQGIRERRPTAVIGVMSPITCPDREDRVGGSGMTLREVREQVGGAVELLRAEGDTALHYLDGAAIVPRPLLREDGLHPTAEGIEAMARRITDEIVDRGLLPGPDAGAPRP